MEYKYSASAETVDRICPNQRITEQGKSSPLDMIRSSLTPYIVAAIPANENPVAL